MGRLNDPSLFEDPSLHLHVSICVDITFGLGNLYEGVLTLELATWWESLGYFNAPYLRYGMRILSSSIARPIRNPPFL